MKSNNNITRRIVLSLIMALALFSSCSKDDDNSPENNTVAIPDVNFEQALIDLEIDTNGLNGNILKTDAEAVITLEISDKNIDNLQGIEAFINLRNLHCGNNNLIHLDASNNTKLFQLFASNNQLTQVDFQNNTELFYINVSNNQLTSLDTSNMTALSSLFCFSNAIEMLDTSNNHDLTLLSCSFNSLTSLDVSNNNILTTLMCDSNALTSLNLKNGNNANLIDFNARSNPNLFCIEVDDVAFSNANWSNGIDGFSVFAENCN